MGTSQSSTSNLSRPTGQAVSAVERKEQRYYDLLAFITSNAVAGEIMAVDNYSEMVALMPDTDSKIETVRQANQETKHIQLLAKLGKRLGFPVKEYIVEPQWLNIRKSFSEAVHKGELTSCLIAQDLMTEAMAIVLYRALGRDTDPDTAQVASNILRDELDHLEIGVTRIKRLLDKDPDHVHDCLVWSHHRVMPELFSMIRTGCHSLCDELGVVCGTLTLESIKTDIDSVRVEALDMYMEMLDRVGFDTRVTTPLIASMSAYGAAPRVDLLLRSDACCESSAQGTATGCC